MKLVPRIVLKAFSFNKFALATFLALVLAAVPQAFAKPEFSTIAVDARTGKIITEIDMDGPRHPASLTKMMTLYMLFNEMKSGRVKLTTQLTISKRAAAMAPSKLGLKPGSSISVQDAIKALVTKSANDVASAIGENLAGSESAFAERMTSTARSIGMSRTTFRNSSGLPNPDQWTTARDMATLGLRLQRDFPQYFPYFRIKTFVFRGIPIKNHNKLLGRYQGVDGIKTGYVAASGFNLVSTVSRGGKKVVAVVMGGTSGAARDQYMMRMLDQVLPVCSAGNTIAALPGSNKGMVVAKDEPAPQPLIAQSDPVTAALPAAEEGDQDDMAKVAAAPPSAKTKGKAKTTGKLTPKGKEVAVAKAAEAPQNNPEETKALEDKMATASDPDKTTVIAQSPAAPDLRVASVGGSSGLPPNLPFEVKKPEGTSDDSSPPSASTAPTVSGKSWNIQVGSYPQKEAARQRLLSMRSSSYAFLKNKSAFTVAVQKGSDIVYRARFSGFNEKSAKDACRRLAKRGQECLAVPPQS